MNSKDLPPICGEEIPINELVNLKRTKRKFNTNSRLENISVKFNSIPYTYLTGVSNRVRKIYVED